MWYDHIFITFGFPLFFTHIGNINIMEKIDLCPFKKKQSILKLDFLKIELTPIMAFLRNL